MTICGTCQHHRDNECRRFPPRYVSNIAYPETGYIESACVYPSLMPDHPSCGEHKPIPEPLVAENRNPETTKTPQGICPSTGKVCVKGCGLGSVCRYPVEGKTPVLFGTRVLSMGSEPE